MSTFENPNFNNIPDSHFEVSLPEEGITFDWCKEFNEKYGNGRELRTTIWTPYYYGGTGQGRYDEVRLLRGDVPTLPLDGQVLSINLLRYDHGDGEYELYPHLALTDVDDVLDETQLIAGMPPRRIYVPLDPEVATILLYT